MNTEETSLKSVIKEYLAIRGVFSYPVLQGIGSFKGLPDRVMHFEGRVHYLEIKRLKGKLSIHQEAFKDRCSADGIHYHIIKSLEDLMEIIE